MKYLIIGIWEDGIDGRPQVETLATDVAGEDVDSVFDVVRRMRAKARRDIDPATIIVSHDNNGPKVRNEWRIGDDYGASRFTDPRGDRAPYVVHPQQGGCLGFYCPGCKTTHSVRIRGDGAWTWNDSVVKPTLAPSVLVKGVKNPWGPDFDATPTVCHSFVRDGRIEFLSDCTHELAGQTVELKPF